ncbi:MAG: Crp/Fnr family transcriptional regulator [Terracidiphilus sp.]
MTPALSKVARDCVACGSSGLNPCLCFFDGVATITGLSQSQSGFSLGIHPLRLANCLKRGYVLKHKDAQGTFDCAAFLANAGLGRKTVELQPKETFFSQGDPANTVFYLQKGRAKLTVVSQNGKEATITLLSVGDFVGEESLASIPGLRLATASAVNTCVALKIARDEMTQVMHDEPSFADFFLKFMLARSMRTQADLVDQLFNSSEKRLARILLLMAEFGKPGDRDTFIPPISQETLAEMIGTTRSRVSFFMNRFRALGYISYNGRIQVNKSLLNVVLLDQLPEHNAQRPVLPLAGAVRKPVFAKVGTILKPVIPIVNSLTKPVIQVVTAAKRKLPDAAAD